MADATPPLLLAARALTFAYGDRLAVRGVSVDLHAGEVVALIGPNGSGKSTLIKLLHGFLRPRSGTIDWDGKPLRKWSRRQFARRVAYLPQSPGYEAGQRVADVLRLGRAPYWGAFGIESTRDVDVIREIAHRLELSDLLDRSIDELSGGQRQAVFVGRCLVQEPAALLLDEPNTFLDLRHQVELFRLLKTLSRERGIGILTASHDLNLSGAFADRLLLLEQGATAAVGTPDEVLRGELLSRVYGLPITRIDSPNGTPLVFPRT